MELRPGTPEEAGFSSERIELVKKRCRQWVDDGTHPSLCVLVARHGVIALHEAYGRLGPQPDAPPLELDSVFALASVTKTITATAVMMLVEDGLVGLTRPVQEYVPDFSGDGKDLVCVHHLLTHTSGIRTEEDVAFILSNWDSSTDISPPDEDVDPIVHKQLVLGGRAPLAKRPGEEMAYANGNYVTLGEIVRVVTGCSLADFARNRIFVPLGMHDAAYIVRDDAVPRVVVAPPEWAALPDVAEFFRAVTAPAAAAHSTAMDLAVFGQTFLNGGTYRDARLISRSTIAEMTRNQIPGVSATFGAQHWNEASWGYGWTVASSEKWPGYPTFPTGTFNHGGAGGGVGTLVWVDPSHDLVGVFLSVARAEIVETTLIELEFCADLFVNAVYAAVD